MDSGTLLFLALGFGPTVVVLVAVVVLYGQPTLARSIRRIRGRNSVTFQLPDMAELELTRRRRKNDAIQAVYRVVREHNRRC